jgi:hypothetical protein
VDLTLGFEIRWFQEWAVLFQNWIWHEWNGQRSLMLQLQAAVSRIMFCFLVLAWWRQSGKCARAPAGSVSRHATT